MDNNTFCECSIDQFVTEMGDIFNNPNNKRMIIYGRLSDSDMSFYVCIVDIKSCYMNETEIAFCEDNGSFGMEIRLEDNIKIYKSNNMIDRPDIYVSYFIYFDAENKNELNPNNYNVVIDILNR